MVEKRLAAVNAHFTPSMVKVSLQDSIATVVMDPPTKLIFLTNALMEQLQQVFLELERDP
jgi:enoyl-CoA hydratase/carnithine racemase